MMPRLTLAIGIVTPMRPVEATSTSSRGEMSKVAAVISSPWLRRRADPALPVQALALPELTTMACAVAAFHARDANFHRRGANLVGREHARRRWPAFGNDQRQVALLAFVRAFAGAEPFDVAKNARRLEALRGGDRTVDGFKRMTVSPNGP